MSRFRTLVGRPVVTAAVALSLAASPMLEKRARACDKGAEVQKKTSFFSSNKLPEILKSVSGKTDMEKVESMFGILKIGAGVLKVVKSGKDNRAPRTVDETIEKGGDCTEFASVMITGMKILGIKGGADIIHFEDSKEDQDHMVAYALIDGKKIYLDPQAEIGKIKGKYKVVMELDFDKAESIPHREMGNYYKLKGKADEAVKEFEKAVELNPEDAYCHYNLAILYEKKGNMKKAKKHYDIAAKLDPENEKYKQHKKKGSYNEEIQAAYAAYEKGDYVSAKEHFENALNSGEKLSKKEKKSLEENIKMCEEMIKQNQ